MSNYEPTIRSLEQIFAWFKKGLYPKAAHFWDTFFSFWHKEDEIPMGSIDGLHDSLNKKYDKTDGEALEQRVDKTEARLDEHDGHITNIYKDLKEHEERLDEHDEHLEKHDGEIAEIQNEIVELHKTDTELRKDLTTAQGNINTVRDILSGGGTLEQAKAAFIALGENYQTVYALATTLKAFLEATDTVDETINTWKEIEAFLEGVTDTESLTLLLEKLETKITDAYKKAISESAAAGSEKVAAERARAEAAEAALGNRITGVRGELYQADVEIKQDVAAVKQTILAMQADSEGRVIPLVVEVDYQAAITNRNPVTQKIKTRLLPSFALQNVLYLGDGKAVDVEPDGSIVPLEQGKSRVHIIPTENTALHKTITIEVVEPSIIKASAGAMLLTGGGSILLT